MFADQEKSISAPGNVAGDGAETVHVDCHVRRASITRHIFDRHGMIAVEVDRDNADRRFQSMSAGTDSAKMRQSHADTDRAVAAHADRAELLKKITPAVQEGSLGLHNSAPTKTSIRAAHRRRPSGIHRTARERSCGVRAANHCQNRGRPRRQHASARPRCANR